MIESLFETRENDSYEFFGRKGPAFRGAMPRSCSPLNVASEPVTAVVS
jgi:hypothetical protein